MTLIVKHPSVPWAAKIVAACAVGYIFSPIQLIPSFIPVIGQLDDLAVLLVGMKIVQRLTPPRILEECELRLENAIRSADPVETSPAEYHRPEAAF